MQQIGLETHTNCGTQQERVTTSQGVHSLGNLNFIFVIQVLLYFL